MAASAEPSTRPRGLRQAVEALRYRDFALFWTGALLSNVGTWMQNVTVPYVLFKQTGSATWVGAAAFMQFVPGVILGPVAGWLADRFDRRMVLIVGQGVSLVLALVLWGMFIAHRATPTVILLIVAAGGVAWGVTVASWQAFVSELVPRKALLNAITLNSAQFNGARAFGPAVGGLVLARFGASWAFLFNAVSYVAVIAALALVRTSRTVRERSTQPMLAQFREGVRYVRKHRGIELAVAIVAAMGFLGGPLFQLAPVLATRVFHVGAGAYGVLAGALGAGGVLGAALLGSVGAGRRRSAVVLVSMVAYACALAGVGLAPTYAVAVACMVVAGVSWLAALATLQTTVQLVVTEAFRGRALAVYVMVFTGAYPLGALLQGWLADVVGARATVVSASVLLLLVALVLVFRPGLSRHLDEHTHRDDLAVLPEPVAAP